MKRKIKKYRDENYLIFGVNKFKNEVSGTKYWEKSKSQLRKEN